jgi:hypothetical protein
MAQRLIDSELMGGARLRFSKVRIFRSSILPFPLAESDPYYLRALRVPHGKKIRTPHKNREECGTRKFNPAPKPDPSAIRKRHAGHDLDRGENPGED